MARIRGIQGYLSSTRGSRRYNQWYRRGYGKDPRYSGLPKLYQREQKVQPVVLERIW